MTRLAAFAALLLLGACSAADMGDSFLPNWYHPWQPQNATQAECDYEAQAASANTPGLVTPALVHNKLLAACLRARDGS